MKLPLIIILSGVATLVLAQAADEGLPSGDELKFFESKIRPVLVESCYQCHSTDEKIRGGLNLDTREGIRHGGDSGPAVTPGDLKNSLLWTAINWAESDYEMPPKRKLPASVIADFRQWIEMGAPDPRVADKVIVKTDIDIDAGKQFWSFNKPASQQPPAVKDRQWPVSDVDRFVLAKLEASGLDPAPDAQPGTLLRRLYFDLTGLPPSIEDLERYAKAWKKDPDKAYEAEVDRLLSSERYGERWGRHWLDVARYAESTGKEVNMAFPQAWRYRDYVINSFNADKPYDEFIREQIAGDLLPIKDDNDWQENLIATGFLAIGPKGLNERSPRQFAYDLADEQVDTTTQAILGLTVSCARCHDHKSDPIPTADYYSLAGIFLSTKTYFGTVNVIQNRRGTKLLELPVPDRNPVSSLSMREKEILQKRMVDSENRFSQLEVEAAQDRAAGRSTNAGQQLQRLRSVISQINARLKGFDEDGHAKTFAMGVQDQSRPFEPTVLLRGEIEKPAQKVERGFPRVLCDEPVALPENSSGRLELARWLASRENPLTARVMVNRIWGKLFGSSIVTSENNFGSTGKAPSHPELLDYLAVKFMDKNWSIKSLLRQLVLTRTYRMSSEFHSAAFKKDPENSLQWRHTPKKIDAEALRDSMLLASGKLDLQRPVGSEIAKRGDGRLGLPRSPRGASAENGELNYRSVYLPAARDNLPEALALFDPADPNLVTGKREETNVPDQALYLMNNPFVIQQAEAMARRLMTEADTHRERFSKAFLLCYARPATNEEIEATKAFMQNFLIAAGTDSQNRDKVNNLAFVSFCQSLLISAEFRYLN
ncbi:MAG: PSD1 and planctomycete cytochrome C domain-containing protein [Verrucomicrobiales bacterium]|nr:PSD1 and planctomycete cytochrome C domain-containing protein [Verrucomicrobiales bacterium]